MAIQNQLILYSIYTQLMVRQHNTIFFLIVFAKYFENLRNIVEKN